MGLSHARTRLRAQQRPFQKFFCPCFTGPFWFNETHSKCLLNQNASLLWFSVQTIAQLSRSTDHFAESVLCLSLYLRSAECYNKRVINDRLHCNTAEVLSSEPCLCFSLMSVETLQQFKLLVVSATEMTF